MASVGPQYMKLKANLELAITRLNIIQAKKYETCRRARREIAMCIREGKNAKARIKVQNIIKEEDSHDTMELIEMFCKMLVEKYELFESTKYLIESLEEAISSLIWVTSYMQGDVPELGVIAKQLARKYGATYARASLRNEKRTVNCDLIEKVRRGKPPAELIEKYMAEIARSHNVQYNKTDSYTIEDIKQNLMKKIKANWGTKECEVYEGYGTAPSQCPFSARAVFEALPVIKCNKSPLVSNKPSARLLNSDCEAMENDFLYLGFKFDDEEETVENDVTPNPSNNSETDAGRLTCETLLSETSRELSIEPNTDEQLSFHDYSESGCTGLGKKSCEEQFPSRDIYPHKDEENSVFYIPRPWYKNNFKYLHALYDPRKYIKNKNKNKFWLPSDPPEERCEISEEPNSEKIQNENDLRSSEHKNVEDVKFEKGDCGVASQQHAISSSSDVTKGLVNENLKGDEKLPCDISDDKLFHSTETIGPNIDNERDADADDYVTSRLLKAGEIP